MGFLESIWRTAGIAPSMGVLDVGCGLATPRSSPTDGRPNVLFVQSELALFAFHRPGTRFAIRQRPVLRLGLNPRLCRSWRGAGFFTAPHHNLPTQLPS